MGIFYWIFGNKKDVKHKNGLNQFHHKNGQLKAEGYKKSRKKDGLWKKWHRNGEIKNEKHH